MSKFVERLVKLRQEEKISQRQLAESTGISKSAIAHYEAGENAPTMHCLIALSRYFGCTIDYLVGEKDDF